MSTNGTSNRNSVKVLAFRAFKQMLAYWPDSTMPSTSATCARPYGIWGYVHMLAKATGATATDPGEYFIDMSRATSPLRRRDGVLAIDVTIAGHFTPTCAMHVTHDIEGAPSKPYPTRRRATATSRRTRRERRWRAAWVPERRW